MKQELYERLRPELDRKANELMRYFDKYWIPSQGYLYAFQTYIQLNTELIQKVLDSYNETLQIFRYTLKMGASGLDAGYLHVRKSHFKFPRDMFFKDYQRVINRAYKLFEPFKQLGGNSVFVSNNTAATNKEINRMNKELYIYVLNQMIPVAKDKFFTSDFYEDLYVYLNKSKDLNKYDLELIIRPNNNKEPTLNSEVETLSKRNNNSIYDVEKRTVSELQNRN